MCWSLIQVDERLKLVISRLAGSWAASWSAQFELIIVDAARSVWEDESATLFSALLVHEEIYRQAPQDARVYTGN